jgi:hypothetical protein
MKNVRAIIDLFGGMPDFPAIRIEGRSKAMMPLCIERIGVGPRGMPLVSVAHYYQQNGDAMRDPDITFEIPANPKANWLPVSYRQDGGFPLDQTVVFERNGQVYMNTSQARSIASFAATWDRNIGEQGYVATALKMAAQARSNPQVESNILYAAAELTTLFPMDETPLGILLDDNPIED